MRFLERVRSAFSHDLRTPLGVIVNYAAVLESPAATAHEEVQNLARSIRSNAERASEMLARLVEAMEFAAAAAAPEVPSVDLVVLARAALAHARGSGDARIAAGATGAQLHVDPAPLQYAWRAYLGVVVGSSGNGRGLSLEVRVHSDGASHTIDLCCGEQGTEPAQGVPTSDAAFDEPAQFLKRAGTSTRTANALALGLARELFVTRGGELSAWGAPKAHSALRVRVPG